MERHFSDKLYCPVRYFSLPHLQSGPALYSFPHIGVIIILITLCFKITFLEARKRKTKSSFHKGRMTLLVTLVLFLGIWKKPIEENILSAFFRKLIHYFVSGRKVGCFFSSSYRGCFLHRVEANKTGKQLPRSTDASPSHFCIQNYHSALA